ncbi:MAG: hypothetical protein UW87_C0019G0012 [Candidatus Moranbacteria bacterium GW2011_GWC2_45_10]|nr:MAG: hypothetical protein UW87_C0019G0012 [Candidatus Moranbacteria bacterium GW2011_GWC2_45_10]
MSGLIFSILALALAVVGVGITITEELKKIRLALEKK